ncbi:GNAT family N-acetyltransferase [Gracilibacillus sp. S3-1-1]|uniref:GNAT family N-acetyltransferase n=1 Tax=Gracilibacillus pellucidus TaxID=3095368 RepID=A0ACC6M8L4_9BACI|nr:GNAT family N-acetyltransferase [Gracilibacillus sp. S3-1-1]MDX8047208.1 GNAT family N-acetyltransferase [Gracilibacillus sp. S3-1-1]
MHLGMVDISTVLREEFQWGLIGYFVHNQYWGNGYGKEAVQAVMNIAFHKLGFHRLEAHINLDNSLSVKLAERVGMEFECVRKAFLYENDDWTDHLLYYKNAK